MYDDIYMQVILLVQHEASNRSFKAVESLARPVCILIKSETANKAALPAFFASFVFYWGESRRLSPEAKMQRAVIELVLA